MRIIHTADWHVGVRLENYERNYEHQQFFKFLYSYLEKEQAAGHPIDAILISGDLYNSFVPPQELQKSLNSFLSKLLNDFVDLNIYITSGNHDNGQLLDNIDIISMCDRLHCLGTVPLVEVTNNVENKVNNTEEATSVVASNVMATNVVASNKTTSSDVKSEELENETNFESNSISKSETEANSHLPKRKRFKVDIDRMLKPLKDKNGKVQAWIAMLPFVREGVLGRGVLFDDESIHTAAECVEKLCQRLAHRLEELKTEFGTPKAMTIAMAHLMVKDKASIEDSGYDEGILGAGSLVSIVGDGIDHFDYTALGHIHKRYSTGTIAGGGRLHYSGSPLPVTFSEALYQHGFNVIELSPDGSFTKELVLVPRCVEMIKIPSNGGKQLGCSPKDALEMIRALPNNSLPLEARPFVSVYLSSEALNGSEGNSVRSRSDITAEIRQAIPENYRLCSVRTVESKRTYKNTEEEEVLQDLGSVTPVDVFGMYVKKKLGTEEIPKDLLKLFKDVLRKVNQAPTENLSPNEVASSLKSTQQATPSSKVTNNAAAQQ